MIEIVQEFVVKVEARGFFELAFGPGGAWSNLFDRCPGFHGTALLRDTADPRRYLVIELWETPAHREEAMAEWQDEYAALQASFAEWTASQTELGVFRIMAEAGVRPRGRARQSRDGDAHPRSRRSTE